jgi:hypothetical protein
MRFFSILLLLFFSCNSDINQLDGKWEMDKYYPFMKLSSQESLDMKNGFKDCSGKSNISIKDSTVTTNCNFITDCQQIRLLEKIEFHLDTSLTNEAIPILDIENRVFDKNLQKIIESDKTSLSIIKTDCILDNFGGEVLLIFSVDNNLYLYNGFSLVRFKQ